MRVNLRLVALATLACTLAAPLRAQSAEPKRPKLPEGADSNSAATYHQFGLASMHNRPGLAADAFYWAGRLEPTAASALYARYIAMLIQDRRTAARYYFGDESLTRSKEIKRIDSLAYRAFLLDPFLPRQLYAHLTAEAIYYVTDGEASVIPPSVAREYPQIMARQAYERGAYADAAAAFARAIKRYPKWYWLHDERADALFLDHQYDSAVSELQVVLAEQRKRDAKKLVYAYESKAFTEFKIGWALAHKGDLDATREAYGRALTEDISFWRAHEALADVALAQGDSAVALQELDLAAQIATAEATLQEKYAVMLAAHGRLDDAGAALRKAIAAEPHYPRPYLFLARLLEIQDKKAEAAEQYRAFVVRAPQNAAGIEDARQKAATLSAAGGY